MHYLKNFYIVLMRSCMGNYSIIRRLICFFACPILIRKLSLGGCCSSFDAASTHLTRTQLRFISTSQVREGSQNSPGHLAGRCGICHDPERGEGCAQAGSTIETHEGGRLRNQLRLAPLSLNLRGLGCIGLVRCMVATLSTETTCIIRVSEYWYSASRNVVGGADGSQGAP